MNETLTDRTLTETQNTPADALFNGLKKIINIGYKTTQIAARAGFEIVAAPLALPRVQRYIRQEDMQVGTNHGYPIYLHQFTKVLGFPLLAAECFGAYQGAVALTNDPKMGGATVAALLLSNTITARYESKLKKITQQNQNNQV